MCKASCSKIIESLYFKRGRGVLCAFPPGLPEIRTAATHAPASAGFAGPSAPASHRGSTVSHRPSRPCCGPHGVAVPGQQVTVHLGDSGFGHLAWSPVLGQRSSLRLDGPRRSSLAVASRRWVLGRGAPGTDQSAGPVNVWGPSKP